MPSSTARGGAIKARRPATLARSPSRSRFSSIIAPHHSPDRFKDRNSDPMRHHLATGRSLRGFDGALKNESENCEPQKYADPFQERVSSTRTAGQAAVRPD